MERRKLFCEVNALTYQISVFKCRTLRNVKNIPNYLRFANEKQEEQLPIRIYKHNSLIRRKLGNVDLQLQENKANNLMIATPKVNKILIRPGQTFSFWKLVGKCTKSRGYKTGLTISGQQATKGVGGGLCQFTNLIHWMILHTDLTIIEHHHHDGLDLFPDFGRQIPFGTGTSIVYNYLDYRFINNTDSTYQLIVYTDDEYLRGEIRADKPQTRKYHIKMENEFFSRKDGVIYRNGEIFREIVCKETGLVVKRELIKRNHATVMYSVDESIKVVEEV